MLDKFQLFWDTMELCDWDNEGDDDKVLKPVIEYLSTQSDDTIFEFDNLMSELLYNLDTKKLMEECEKAVQLLKSQGYNPGLVNVRFIRPMDEEMLHVLSKKYSLIVTVEENQLIGGYGQMVSAFLHKNVCKNQLLTLGISDYFVGHATVNEQREEAGINADSIVKSIIDRMN